MLRAATRCERDGCARTRLRGRARLACGAHYIYVSTSPRRATAEEEGFEPTVPLRVRRFSKCWTTGALKSNEGLVKATGVIEVGLLVYSGPTRAGSWEENHDE